MIMLSSGELILVRGLNSDCGPESNIFEDVQDKSWTPNINSD